MYRKIIYTKYALKCFRIIAFLCAIVLFSSILYTIINTIMPLITVGNKISFKELFYTGYNIIVLSLCIFLIFFPHKFGITSIISFCYSAMIIPFEQENYMGIMMFFLGVALLFVRGLMKKHKKVKLIILISVLFALQFSNIRFGIHSFINYFIVSTGGMLVMCLYSFIVYAYDQNSLIHEEKKLNLASYSRLNERDFKILQLIQTGKKYSVIANELNMAEGYLKNRLHLIFTIMEVGDRQGFMSFYDDYELSFDPETAIPVSGQL